VHRVIKRAALLIIPLLLVLISALGINYLLEHKKDIFTTRPVSVKAQDPVNAEPVIKAEPQQKQEPLAVKEKPSSIPVVVIDPAHGGDDAGHVGYHGAVEAQANLQFAFMLARELRMKGIRVYLTRTDDKNLSLDKRINYSNELKPLLHLSINCAYSSISTISGMEIFAFTLNKRATSWRPQKIHSTRLTREDTCQRQRTQWLWSRGSLGR